MLMYDIYTLSFYNLFIIHRAQAYMKGSPVVEVPAGMDPSTPRKRQKLVLRLLMSMEVLSVAKAQSEQLEDRHSNKG